MQLADHPFHLGENHRDCCRVGRGGDAGGLVALRRLTASRIDCQRAASRLMTRMSAYGRIVARSNHSGIEHCHHAIEVGAGEIGDMARQAVRDQRQDVSRLEDDVEIAQIVERLDAAELTGETPVQ